MIRSATNDPLRATTGPVALLIGTRKGAFVLRGDRTRRTWKVSAPMFLGHIVHHVVLDPRDRRTMLMAASTGHLGPTIFRSTDLGKTWKEAKTPPAFPKAPEGQNGRVVNHVFWLTPGHPSETGPVVRRHLAAGTIPLQRRRRHVGAIFLHQRRSAVPRVDGHRAGRHPGWTEAALDPRRPARPRPPLLRHVRRRCA